MSQNIPQHFSAVQFVRLHYLYKKIVATRDALHDVSLDFIVFQYCEAIIDEDWWMCGLKIGAKIWWWLLHIDCRHLSFFFIVKVNKAIELPWKFFQMSKFVCEISLEFIVK